MHRGRPAPFALFCTSGSAPLARCTARVHRRHQVGQVLRSFRCLGSPGARALVSGCALHFPPHCLPRQQFLRFLRDFSGCRKVRLPFALLKVGKTDGGRLSWTIRESLALVSLRKLDGGPRNWTVRESFALVRRRSLDPSQSQNTLWRLRRLLLRDVLVVLAGYAAVLSRDLRRGFCECGHNHHGLFKRPGHTAEGR